jgi:energy-coupling factor transporter transmembrane protein EcfT
MARLSPVALISPSCRLCCLAFLSSACLLMSPLTACVASIILVALIQCEGIGLGRILREASFLLWLAAFSLLIQGLDISGGLRLNRDGLEASSAYCARLLAAYLAGRLFYAATTRAELRDAATRAARIFPGRAGSDVGLALSLVLGSLPLIVEEWRESLEAARARAMPKRPGFARSATLLTAYLRRLMFRSLSLPEALAARGWSGDRHLRSRPWLTRDYLSVLFCGALLLGTVLRIV